MAVKSEAIHERVRGGNTEKQSQRENGSESQPGKQAACGKERTKWNT